MANPTMALPRVQPLRSPAAALDTVVVIDERGYFRGSLRRFSDGLTEWICDHPHVEHAAAFTCAVALWGVHRLG